MEQPELDTDNRDEKTKIQDLICEIQDTAYSLESRKLQDLKPFVEDLFERVMKARELDLDLRDGLLNTMVENENNQIISDEEFANMLSHIRDDALIVYIKKAQAYKVYNPSEDGNNDQMLDTFVNDDNTKFRIGPNRNNGPVYEVVRDTHPQRLLITIKDNIQSLSKIQKIKQQIVSFIKKHKEFAKTSVDNLKVYGNEQSTEFLVGNIIFKNLQERDIFIERFIKYMKVEVKDHYTANKIELHPEPGDTEGTRFYQLGSQKNPKDSTVINNSQDHLVTGISLPTQIPVSVTINNTLTIQNSGTINNTNNVGNNISNIVSTSTNSSNTLIAANAPKTIKSFCLFLYNSKPDWYLEGEYVELDVIEQAYKEYFGEEDTTSSVIAKQLNGILYNNSRRKTHDGKSKTLKKLVKREALKKV